jgi:ribonuclease Z
VIDVALLGTGGMMPLPNRWLATAMVRANDCSVLIDCGEGTQIAGRLYGFGFREIDAILLTHYHPDHIAGLPGLLNAMAFADRSKPVLIAGPPGLGRRIHAVLTLGGGMPFAIQLLEVDDGSAFGVGPFTIGAALGDHAVPCLGYRLDLARAPSFLPERARDLGVPVRRWKDLQRGLSVKVGDRVVEPAEVLGPPRPGLRVGYLTDTRPTPALADFFRGADLLICEATFGDPAVADRAIERKHMLFREAAELARSASAARLWLTHFSPSLADPSEWAEEATSRFPQAVVGFDGLRDTLTFVD